MTSRSEARGRLRLPLVAIPLCAYLGETLVVPAMNGAIGRRGFWEHAAITAGVAGAIAAMWFVLASPLTPRATRRSPPDVIGSADRGVGEGNPLHELRAAAE